MGLLSVRRRRRHVAHDGRPGVTSQRRLQDPRELRVAERDVRALALRPLRQLVDDDTEVQEGLVDVGPFLHADPLGASLEHALGPRQVHQVERGHQHRVVSAVRGPGRVLADSPGLDHHAEDGVRPRRFRVHVGLPHVPPGDAGSEQLEHLRWVGHDLLHQPGDVHAALGVLLDLQAGDASVGSVEGSAPDGAPEQVPRAAAAHLRLGLPRGGLGGEQIQHLLIVDLEVADAHEELPALAAVDAVENVVHGEWDDARLIRAALHGVRLSRGGLTVREARPIDASQDGLDDAPGRAFVHVLGAARRIEDVVELIRGAVGGTSGGTGLRVGWRWRWIVRSRSRTRRTVVPPFP